MEEKENQEATPSAAMPLKVTTTRRPRSLPGTGTDDQFCQSLRELKELRSQLYQAAEHCEVAFHKAPSRKLVMENTKGYICQSIVTVIDHLGTVSYNLDRGLRETIEVAQTEQRIDSLRQRLQTCEKYALSLELSTMCWRTNFPRHHRHYISPLVQHHEKPKNVKRDDASADLKVSERPCNKDQLAVPTGFSMFDSSVNGNKTSATTPSFRGTSLLPKSLSISFGSQVKNTHMLISSDQKKKFVQGSNLLSFLRISRRKT